MRVFRLLPHYIACKGIRIGLDSFIMQKKVFYITSQKRLWVLYRFPKPVQPPTKTAA
jgi:hypothetical protein